MLFKLGLGSHDALRHEAQIVKDPDVEICRQPSSSARSLCSLKQRAQGYMTSSMEFVEWHLHVFRAIGRIIILSILRYNCSSPVRSHVDRNSFE